jgi:hypothetical protein
MLRLRALLVLFALLLPLMPGAVLAAPARHDRMRGGRLAAAPRRISFP